VQTIQALINNVEKVIIGKRSVIEMAVISLLCRGHILIEDVPGTGKTMMARALAKSVDVDMNRLQCTPDLLPSDITGVPIFNQKNSEFEFRAGPVFTHFLLADEINRATPRAQSALLECMEEFRVSVDGTSYDLPSLFMVLATQNPIDMVGTHTLPEAQLDRFFMRLNVGYPSLNEEANILNAQSEVHPIEHLTAVTSKEEILKARQIIKKTHINEDVVKYIVGISAATRAHHDLRLGVSPRGSLALSLAARGLAFLRGRDYVTPDMVKDMAGPVLEHRLIVSSHAAVQGKTAKQVLKEVMAQIAPPV